ncbi:MAG: 30S ribosomal protein S17 [Candidatus Sungbacteria bacterium]|uniref:Small ribosomal subunit protein uS17 n=1 Tax=Candidatus Sungiibacteriota bacterium TaxID=2750080 RepID=A0A9D6LNB9_9BACT|nr:30S ribosomal protein S17 [Candidatus Sungbacteria bacterium]
MEKHPRTLEGTVASNKMQKTAVVLVSRLKKNPKYLKYEKRSTKFKVHDEDNSLKVGDVVKIQETRPLSKDKRWKVVEVLESKGNTAVTEEE